MAKHFARDARFVGRILPRIFVKDGRVEIRVHCCRFPLAIVKGPELELATERLTIIRWTTNNPGGSDVHYGIVRYGTDPKDLSQTAKSPIRLNQGHAYTTYRVRIEGLKPGTVYYYTVTSEESNGKSSGVKSAVKEFTTPGPGERIVGSPR